MRAFLLTLSLINFTITLSFTIWVLMRPRYNKILYRTLDSGMVQATIIGRCWTKAGARDWTTRTNIHLGWDRDRNLHVDWSRR